MRVRDSRRVGLKEEDQKSSQSNFRFEIRDFKSEITLTAFSFFRLPGRRLRLDERRPAAATPFAVWLPRGRY
jgi:hypothetical protein